MQGRRTAESRAGLGNGALDASGAVCSKNQATTLNSDPAEPVCHAAFPFHYLHSTHTFQQELSISKYLGNLT